MSPAFLAAAAESGALGREGRIARSKWAFLEFQPDYNRKIKDLGNGGPGGTRTPNQAVMSRRL